MSNAERVISYIDGFNLYFGIKSTGRKHLYWLDIEKLSKDVTKPGQVITKVNYFTARINNDPLKQKRQNTYLEAVESLHTVTTFFGKYVSKKIQCPHCSNRYKIHSEKMTDVNIAVEMLGDAHRDEFDTAILFSADSDLVGTIREVKRDFPVKRVLVAFPPGRTSKELQSVADGVIHLTKNKLSQCQLPEMIEKNDGYQLKRPDKWKKITQA